MPSLSYSLGYATVGALLTAPLMSRASNDPMGAASSAPTNRRRSFRLQGFDYSKEGAYFVTVCTQNRERLFGDVMDGVMHLNDAGRLVQTVWDELPARCPGAYLDAFVVMPNHIHGIIIVGAPLVGAQKGTDDGATTRVAPTVGSIVGAFKSITTNEYIRGVITGFRLPFLGRLWQRNYYEHVIRSEESLNCIRDYIATNPFRWELDRENPARQGEDEFDRWLATFKSRPDKRKNP